MKHKVEIWNRGDAALEVMTDDPNGDGVLSHILHPGERVTFDAEKGIGVGPHTDESPSDADAVETTDEQQPN